MGKKRSTAKAVLVFALSAAGTVAGNLVYHYFKDKHDAELNFKQKQKELEDWKDEIPDEQQKADETAWGIMAENAEEKVNPEQQEDKAEIIWQELSRLEKVNATKNEGRVSFDNAEPIREVYEGLVSADEGAKSANGTLSENEKLVLELHEVFGGELKSKQIAERTGMGRSTVDEVKRRLVEKGYKTVDGKRLRKNRTSTSIDWNEADNYIMDGSKSNAKISEIFGCSESTISRRRTKLKADGRITA